MLPLRTLVVDDRRHEDTLYDPVFGCAHRVPKIWPHSYGIYLLRTTTRLDCAVATESRLMARILRSRHVVAAAWRPLTFPLTLLLNSASTFGQSSTGTIVGTIRDSSGAVLPGVSVTIRNEGTNSTRDVVTGASGDYSEPLLPPGSYEVSAALTGFGKKVARNIQLQVNQTVRMDFALPVATLQEDVQASATAPLIQTDTSSIGQVVGQVRIENLPLNERNFVNFAYLAPGVQIDAENTLVSSQGLALSANGARQISNNFLLDGIDNNDLVINQYSALPSVDAIQEFKVQTGIYSAEYGRSSGAQINVVLKSGSNKVSGTAYEYFRNRHLDAKNAFDLPGDIPRLDRSQFGVSFGGPLRRDKTFVFLSFGHKVNPFDPLSPYTQLPGYGTTVDTDGQNGGFNWNHIFSTSVLNEFRGGFNGEHGVFLQADRTDHNAQLGFPNVLTAPIDLGWPNVSVAGFDGIGQPTNTPQDHPTYTLHLMDNFVWNPRFNGGKHQFKLGGEFRRYFYHLLFDTSARGIWNFNGTASTPSLVQLLQGIPSNAQTVNSEVNMDRKRTS